MSDGYTMMPMFLLYAAITSAIGYYFLQNREDKKADKEGKERATTGKKVMLLFILFLVSAILFYFIGNGIQTSPLKLGGGASGVEMERPNVENMLKRIPEDMQTGIPPFKSMSFASDSL